VLCWSLPVAALLLILPVAERRQAEAVTQAPSTTVVVAERAQNLRQSIDLVFTMTAPAVVRVTEGGVVTSLEIAAGEPLTQGRVLLAIDGIQRRAYLGHMPVFRELGSGDSGPDVAALHAYLIETGTATELPGDRFTSRTARAVRAFQSGIGAPTDGRFRPSYVVYVPAGTDVVGTVRAELGATLDARAAVFESGSRPSGVRVEAPEGAPVAAAALDAPLVFTWRDASVTTASGTLTAADAVALYEMTGAGGASTNRGDDDAEAGGEHRVSGIRVELQEPRRAGVVPGTAVLTDSGGTRCVFLVEDGTERPDAFVLDSFDLVAGELGVVAVDVDLIGRSVVRDPARLTAEDRSSCG